MVFNIIIIDKDNEKLPSFTNKEFKTFLGDVKNYTSSETPIYFVSPANSKGFLNGGIDQAYMDMFDNIQQKVQDKIKTTSPFKDKFGLFYLPIGSAITVQVDENKFLISAPTMLMPQSVKNTKNPYWTMKAILNVWNKSGVLIIPPLCCGYGCISAEESSKQMQCALEEHQKYLGNENYFSQPNLDEQPNYYENTQFKDIKIEDIVKK